MNFKNDNHNNYRKDIAPKIRSKLLTSSIGILRARRLATAKEGEEDILYDPPAP